ncbi:MAG TPA: GrpB family protein [Acidobacteriota bacterium]|nr:GrpB family protein [Acidobacteriota bacterium]
MELEIVPYDPTWPDAFNAERERISAVLGDLAVRIEHHGSTSVPGLAAKPVIDIQVSVRRLLPIEEYVGLLAKIGYIHVPHEDDSFCPFFHRPATWTHSHHVHLVQSGGAEERRTLAFRDYLRENPNVAQEYEKLKRGLVTLHSGATFNSREAYADAKTAFVTRITKEALKAGYPRSS